MTKEELQQRTDKIIMDMILDMDKSFFLRNGSIAQLGVMKGTDKLISLIKEVVESVIPEEKKNLDVFNKVASFTLALNKGMNLGYNLAIKEVKDNLDKLLKE